MPPNHVGKHDIMSVNSIEICCTAHLLIIHLEILVRKKITLIVRFAHEALKG